MLYCLVVPNKRIRSNKFNRTVLYYECDTKAPSKKKNIPCGKPIAMNGYSNGKGKEKDRYLPARRKGGESGKWIDVVAYGGFSALLALILKYAISGQYWNLNFFLLALQVRLLNITPHTVKECAN